MTITIYETSTGISFKTKVSGDEATRLYQAMNKIKPLLDSDYPIHMVAGYLQHLLPQDKIIID